MARTLDQMVSELPPAQQQRIEQRYQELKQEVESLRQLRQIAGKVQVEVAVALKITQPSVAKIEKQADMYISTMRNYIEAIGGELELVVRLPGRPALRLHCLGDALPEHHSEAAGADTAPGQKPGRKRQPP